jgi:hypothetical protein
MSSEEFDGDRPAPGHLTVPETRVYAREGEAGHRLALVGDASEVSVRLSDKTAGRVGDALAAAVAGIVADDVGWSSWRLDDPALPAAHDGLDGGVAIVDEGVDGRALLELRASAGLELAVQLCSASAFAVGPVLWAFDEHERPPDD